MFVFQDGIAGVILKCDQPYTVYESYRAVICRSHFLCFVLFVAFDYLDDIPSNLFSCLSVYCTNIYSWIKFLSLNETSVFMGSFYDLKPILE